MRPDPLPDLLNADLIQRDWGATPDSAFGTSPWGISMLLLCGYFILFCFFRAWHMEVLRLGIESELQLPAYATATLDPSHVCDLYHNVRFLTQ